MKKLTLICTLVCLFTMGTMDLLAQDKSAEVQAAASEQATELRKAFGLNDKQTKELYQAIYKRDKTLNFTDYSAMTAQEKMKFVSQTNDDFKQTMMTILTEEQFNKYVSWLEKKKKTAH